MLKLILLILAFLSPSLKALNNPPSAATDGQRIDLWDAGFSMVPPSGWEILRNAGGSSLLFKAPKQGSNDSYQATIQVMVFNGPRYIDEISQEEFGRIIVDKFTNASNRVQNYRLRSGQKVKLESGDDAILYYTEFQIDDVNLMQMHILLSSKKNHFLLTYTDLAKYFEQDNSRELAVAYTSMHSAVLTTKAPSRYEYPIIGGGIGLSLILLGFLIRAIRAHRLRTLSNRLEEEDGEELHTDAESVFYSRHSQLEKKSKRRPKDEDDEDSDDGDDDEEEVRSRVERSAPPPTPRVQDAIKPHKKPVQSSPSVPKPMPPPEPRTQTSPGVPSRAASTIAQEESDVARISQILPHDGLDEDDQPTKTKRGFFKRKAKEETQDRDDEDSQDSSWASSIPAAPLSTHEEPMQASRPPRSLAKVAKTNPRPAATAVSSTAVSAVASQLAPMTEDAWNLGGNSESFADEDDEAEDED